MPTIVKTSACCAIFELALRLSHALNMALTLRRFFLSLIIYVCAWIPTEPKNTLGNTYSCPQHIVSFPSTLFPLCYQKIDVGIYPGNADFVLQHKRRPLLSSRGPSQPCSLRFDHLDWRSVWNLLYVPFPLNLGFISTGGRRSEMGGKESVMHTQARKPACIPRSTAAGTAKILQEDALQKTCFVFHQQPQF